MKFKYFRREIRKCDEGENQIKQLGVREVIHLLSPPLWGNLKSGQNTDKISK